LKVTNFTTRTRKRVDPVVRKAKEGIDVALLKKAIEKVDVALLKKAKEVIDTIMIKATIKADSIMMKAIE